MVSCTFSSSPRHCSTHLSPSQPGPASNTGRQILWIAPSASRSTFRSAGTPLHACHGRARVSTDIHAHVFRDITALMDSNTEPRSRRYAPVGSLNLGTEALMPDPEFPVVGFKASISVEKDSDVDSERSPPVSAKGRRRCRRRVAENVGVKGRGAVPR